MKRVVFFGIKTFPSRGGTDRVAENLMRHLKDQFQITVYCFSDPSAKNNIPGVRVIQFRQLLPGALGTFIYFLVSAVHLLFAGGADVVHMHKTESTFFAPLLRLRFRIISTSHEAQYKSDKWNLAARLFFHLVEWTYIRFSHACTCIGRPLTEFYSRKHGREIVFIPNGINQVTPEMIDVRAAGHFVPTGADINAPFILFAARRLMKIKGCHFMLEALQRIGYSGQIFITGELHTDPKYMDHLTLLSKELNVHFLGLVNSLPALLGLVSKSSIFVFPSVTEGMSIMLLEVASVGTPIIASDIAENQQVFGTEEVLYFRSERVDDLTKKLEWAIQNPELMRVYGRNAQERVLSDYLWSGIASRYADLYHNLMLD